MKLTTPEKMMLLCTAIFICATGYQSVNGALVAGSGSADYPKYSEYCFSPSEAGILAVDNSLPTSGINFYEYNNTTYDRISFVGRMPCDYELNTSVNVYWAFMSDSSLGGNIEWEYFLGHMNSGGVLTTDFSNETLAASLSDPWKQATVFAGTVSGGYSEPNVGLYGEVGRDGDSGNDSHNGDCTMVFYCIKYIMDTAGCSAGQFIK